MVCVLAQHCAELVFELRAVLLLLPKCTQFASRSLSRCWREVSFPVSRFEGSSVFCQSLRRPSRLRSLRSSLTLSPVSTPNNPNPNETRHRLRPPAARVACCVLSRCETRRAVQLVVQPDDRSGVPSQNPRASSSKVSREFPQSLSLSLSPILEKGSHSVSLSLSLSLEERPL